MKTYNKVIAFSRVRDCKKDNDSICKFISSRLNAFLGPCGQKVEKNENTIRFYFDTFNGLSIPFSIHQNNISKEDILKFLQYNNNQKEQEMINKFFKLGDIYFSIEEETTCENRFLEDFILGVENIISLCGGGVVLWINDEENNYDYKIIGGYKIENGDKDNAITLTNKMINSNVFDEQYKQIACNIGFDGIPKGYYYGFSMGFLKNRFVFVRELSEEKQQKLKTINSTINTAFINLEPNPVKRVKIIDWRLNTISFIQFLVCEKNIDVTKETLLENWYIYKEEYLSYIENLGYDSKKNSNGILQLVTYIKEN